MRHLEARLNIEHLVGVDDEYIIPVPARERQGFAAIVREIHPRAFV